MPDNTNLDFQGVLNKLANLDPPRAPQRAANLWAGTQHQALLAALNVKAGTTGLGLREVCNRIAGTTNLDPVAALNSLYASGQNVGSVDHIVLPGNSSNYIQSSSAFAPWSVTGDIDIRIKVGLNSWQPGSEQALLGKWNAGNSFLLTVQGSGNILFAVRRAGGTTVLLNGNGSGFAAGSVRWIRATRVAATGVMRMYSSSDGTNWTEMSNFTDATGNIAVDTSPITVGAQSAGTASAAGKFFYAEVRSGIDGTVVGSFNPAGVTGAVFTTRTPSTWSSAEGATWTVNGTAWSWGSTNTGTDTVSNNATSYV